MNKLIALTQHVREWNMMGYSLLPTLQVCLITDQEHQKTTQQLLKQLSCVQIVLAGDKENGVYKIYKMMGKVEGKLHLLKGINSTQPLEDQEFRNRRSAIQKLRTRKDVIFMKYKGGFNNTLDFSERTAHLQLMGFRNAQFIRTQDIVIDQYLAYAPVYWEIFRRYEALSRFQLLSNYQQMKNLQKQLKKSLVRYLDWKQVMEGKVDQQAYGFRCMQHYQDLVISSLQGIYSVKEEWMKGKSIRWEVMELLEALWDLEGDTLSKQIDMLPLSFIEEQYKMSNYHSIGGFLPETCFRNIFSPPLKRLQSEILHTMEAAKFKIIKIVEDVLEHYFIHTNALDQFMNEELSTIEQICDSFLEEFEKNIQSQIEYIHAPAQDFWGYRSVQSNLYSPQQQIYIQIKYIGKTYIKRVFQTIRDTVPRYVGQNLLRSIVSHLKTQTFENLIKITSKTQFKLSITQKDLSKFQRVDDELIKVDSLIKFFSLKVNTCHLIKDLHNKNQKHWRRMFGEPSNEQDLSTVKAQQNQRGVREWIKQLFRSNRSQIREKRAKSQQKKAKLSSKIYQEQADRKEHSINQKQWLLIINTDRKVEKHRVELSSRQGFPKRMRSAIWLYLARTSSSQVKMLKVSQLLSKQKPLDLIQKQIEKDVKRTHPHKLFQGQMYDCLTRVLQAYSVYDKELSYTQGMNFIAATIICTIINYGEEQSHYLQNAKPSNSEIEEKAFVIFRYLMMEKGLRKVMFIERQTLTDLCWRLDTKIKDRSGIVMEKIAQIGLNSEMIFTSALISSLTAITMDMNIYRRVFDMLIVTGINIIPLVIAEFVINAQDQIMRFRDSDEIYNYIKGKVFDDVYQSIGDQGLTKMFKTL